MISIFEQGTVSAHRFIRKNRRGLLLSAALLVALAPFLAGCGGNASAQSSSDPRIRAFELALQNLTTTIRADRVLLTASNPGEMILRVVFDGYTFPDYTTTGLGYYRVFTVTCPSELERDTLATALFEALNERTDTVSATTCTGQFSVV